MARFTGTARPLFALGEARIITVTTPFLMNWPAIGGGQSSDM